MNADFPNFFLAGVSKCGTTSMADYLTDHPEVFMSVPKEPQYFAFDMPHMQHVKTERAYLELFTRAEKQHRIRGEASATYLFSDVAISKVMEANPDAKFLIMIRNPVDLVYSFHQELLHSRRETVEDFEEAWNLQEVRLRGEHLPASTEPKLLQYRAFVDFKTQIERFYASVPEAQRMMVLFDDLVADPADLYSRVLDFLELDHDGRTEFQAANPSKSYRMKWVGDIIMGIQKSPLRHFVTSAKTKLGLKKIPIWSHLRDMNVATTPRRSLDPAFRASLCEVLAPQVEYLSGIFNRDLSHWLEPLSDD